MFVTPWTSLKTTALQNIFLYPFQIMEPKYMSENIKEIF